MQAEIAVPADVGKAPNAWKYVVCVADDATTADDEKDGVWLTHDAWTEPNGGTLTDGVNLEDDETVHAFVACAIDDEERGETRTKEVAATSAKTANPAARDERADNEHHQTGGEVDASVLNDETIKIHGAPKRTGGDRAAVEYVIATEDSSAWPLVEQGNLK